MYSDYRYHFQMTGDSQSLRDDHLYSSAIRWFSGSDVIFYPYMLQWKEVSQVVNHELSVSRQSIGDR